MNLVEALTSGDAEYAMLTTFPFDARFYTEYLSRELSSAGIVSPVILMDHDRYQQNLDNGIWKPGSIQGDYYLEPVDVPGTFHPKVAVTGSDDEIHVTVSSANLTLSEMTSAAQLATQVTVKRDEDTPDEHAAVVQDVLSFVETLEQYVGRDGGTQLGRLTDATSWVNEQSLTGVPGTRFVHNLTTPILPQVIEQFGEVEILQLAAPFFGSPGTVAEIVEMINPDECELLIDNGTTYIDLEAVVDAIDCPVTVRRLEYSSGRWVHAKFLCVKGSEWSGCLYGSPNQTGQALLSDADSGNVEAGILRTEADASYFSDGPPLFDSEAFPLQLSEPVSDESLTTNSYSEMRSSRTSPSVDLHLKDVFVQTETKDAVQLELALSTAGDPLVREAEATLHALEDESHQEISWQESDDDAETDVVRTTVSAPNTWRNTVVRVELADGRRSGYRQVTVEPTPYTRSQSKMNVTGGRRGVRELIWNLIFMNDPRAGESLSTSAKSLQHRLENSTRGGPQLVEDTDSSWTISRRRNSGGSSRVPHHQLKDSLELSKTNLLHFIAQPPDPEYAQEVVEHLENYWLALEAGYIRAILSDQFISDDEMAHHFDPDALLTVVRKYYFALHSEQILRHVGRYLFEGLAIAPDEHSTYLDRDLAFESTFAHPALVLGLDSVADGTGMPPFFFVQEVFHTLSNSQPLIAEQLLDPQTVTECYWQLFQRYEDGVEQLAEIYDTSLTLPSELETVHKTLLYTVWYQELAKHSEGLFGRVGRCEQYEQDALKQLGSLMLQGREHLDAYEGLSEFRSGSLDDIAQKYFGSETGASRREQQIEALADGTYW